VENQSIVRRLAALMLIATAVGGAPIRAHAAEVRVLSAAAMQTVFKTVGDEFERASGHKLIFAYATMGAITNRVTSGETADLIIGSTQSMEQLVKAGEIDGASRVTIAKVGIGTLVAVGTPKPRIETVDDLKRALLAATTVVYAFPAGGGAAGIHIDRVIRQLGIAEALRLKTRFGAGGDVAEVTLGQGPGAFGMTQISEIVNKTGVAYVGPFPEAVQNYTGVTVGIPARTTPSEATRAFIYFLRSPLAIKAIQGRGMQVD
jgi:molybdate transport system substrate-binding protein